MSATYGNFQPKVLTEIFRILQQDAYLKTLVDGRVYAQHVSTLENPVFPCVTMTYHGYGTPGMPDIMAGDLQIDVWSKKNVAELWSIYSSHDYIANKPVGIRALLNRGPSGEPFGFNLPEAICHLCREVSVVDDLYEEWSRTHHFVALYSLHFAARRV
jgi:hypothetical protein